MNRISVELVPRSPEGLRADLALMKDNNLPVDIINIPDLLRMETRSWEGAAIAKEFYPAAMPHLRAIDIDITKPLPMKDYLREHNITEVLVIEGDPPPDMSHTVYPTVTTDVINKFKQEMPEVRVYAGIDQYRGSMRQEEYRIRRKLQAGAVGFFTQPFFDLRFLEMYREMLDGLNVYWGVSPIFSQRSKSYWEMKNNVVFPKGFEPTLEWSVDFSRRVMDYLSDKDDSIYLMPIKSNLAEYLTGVLQ